MFGLKKEIELKSGQGAANTVPRKIAKLNSQRVADFIHPTFVPTFVGADLTIMKKLLFLPVLGFAVSASAMAATAAPAAKVVKVAPAPRREPVQKTTTAQRPVARALTPVERKRVQAARKAQLDAYIAASNALIIAMARAKGMDPEQIRKRTQVPTSPTPKTPVNR